MSTQAQPGPTPTASSASNHSGGGVPLPPTPAQLQSAFDTGIWYALSLWPALHVAVQNGWGGEATLDKKDWFAGAVSELFASRPDTDAEELEIFLLQIMQDEFDCNVEDDSEVEVARGVLRVRKALLGAEAEQQGPDMGVVRELEQRWRNRGQIKTNIQVIDNGAEEVDDDEDWEGFGEDEDGDVDMEAGEAPSLVPAARKKEKVEPEVDEDGFTKVVGKKKR